MKLKYTSGCTAYSVTVDNVEVADMQIEDLQNVIKTAINKVENQGFLQELLSNIIEMEGEWKESDYCEQCGDSIDTFELEI